MLDDPCLDGHAPVISRTAQPQRGAATPTASAGSARSPATQCWSNIATALLHHPDLGDERARLLRRNTAPVANPARANPEIVVTHWIGPVFRAAIRGGPGELPLPNGAVRDRKSAVQGTRVPVRVDLGGRRLLQKKKPQPH